MKTLKTLLLGGIVSILTICGYTSATTYTCIGESESCSPSTYTVVGENVEELDITNASCYGYSNGDAIPEDFTDSCSVIFREPGTEVAKYGYDCIPNGGVLFCYGMTFEDEPNLAGTLRLDSQNTNPTGVFTFDIDSSNIGGNEGGNTGGGSDSGSSDLTSQLTPIITGLTTSINEFIPYVVYVSLGILGVVIGFFAIKRLMRYVKGSTLSVFNSRRKRK